MRTRPITRAAKSLLRLVAILAILCHVEALLAVVTRAAELVAVEVESSAGCWGTCLEQPEPLLVADQTLGLFCIDMRTVAEGDLPWA